MIVTWFYDSENKEIIFFYSIQFFMGFIGIIEVRDILFNKESRIVV